jgi:hypothetical protein
VVGGLSMVVVTDLKKVKKGPKDKTAGKDVYEGTTGFNKEHAFKGEITKPNPLLAKQKDSPDFYDFYRDSTTFGSMASVSQQKLDNFASNPFANFEFPVNNQAVDYWAAMYHDGARKGLISVEDEVGTWSVSHLASQPANSGASMMNPNEANKFPSKGIAI